MTGDELRTGRALSRVLIVVVTIVVLSGGLAGCGRLASGVEITELPSGNAPSEINIGRQIAPRGLIVAGSKAYAVARAEKGFDVIEVSLSDGKTRVLAETTAQEVAVSRDGSLLAFATLSDWYEPCEVRILDLETGDSRKLTDTTGSSRGVDFAPDGESLVFASLEGLVALGLDGSDRKLLVEGRAGGESTVLQWVPKWSPDGARVAYAVTYYEGSGPISVVDVSSGVAQKVTFPDDMDAHWSPDGKSILYTNEGYDSDHSDVCLVDLTETEPQSRVITDSVGFHRGLAWSPDGRCVLIERLPSPHESSEREVKLLIYDLEKGELRELPVTSPVSAMTATWGGDGFIYYATDDGKLMRIEP